MKINKRTTLGTTLILTLLISLLTVGMAFAAEGDPIEGYIMELNPVDGTITIDVDGEDSTTDDVYTVLVGDNFNFDNHDVGDLITVQGTVGEDDVILMTELKIMERVKDQIKLQDGELESYYCDNEDQDHPVALKVADTYDVKYSDIQDYLCGVTTGTSVPLGQIMLAIQTAEVTGDIYTTYLNSDDPIKWGTIWEEGKPDKGTAPGQIQDKQGEEDTEEGDTKGKMNKDGELSECKDGEFLCNVSEWFQSKSGKGNK